MRAPVAAAAAALLSALVLGVAGQAEPGVVASYGQGRLWLKPYDWTYLRGEIDTSTHAGIPFGLFQIHCFDRCCNIRVDVRLFSMRIFRV